MALDTKAWWSTWTPIWEHMENRHMSTYVTDKIMSKISSPVLVIGAGQGLIVKYLNDKGYIADGIDLEDEMIKYAKKRHSIKLIKADANKLPFKDKSYKTVIISSGVVDYNNDPVSIKRIINEALRVTSIHGNLFIAFYQVATGLRKIYKNLGIIDFEKNLRMKRIFDIGEMARKHPLLALEPIMLWTKKGFHWVLLYWSRIGLFFPKALKEEQDKMDFMIGEAKKLSIKEEDLYDCIPESIPYRELNDIEYLMQSLGIFYNSAESYDDCVLVNIYKSGIEDIKQQKKKDLKDDWIIKTENLTKRYKKSSKNAIDMINLSIKKGTIFGLLGPNGAGKTTTLTTLCGLIDPTDGKILFNYDKSKKNLKRIIGIVPQNLALYQRLTAKENLKFFGSIYNIEKKELNDRIQKLLVLVGLQDRANEIVKNYSTGMMRRLNLAIALINNPDIVLMDEPTVGIDPQSRNCIYEAILSLKNNKTTVLYTTHYMEEADKLCDYIAIMDNGRIILEGIPKNLVKSYGLNKFNFQIESKYKNDFVKALMNQDVIIDLNITGKNMSFTSQSIRDNITIINEVKRISKKFNVKLSLINIIEPSLESLFLDITGKDLRDNLA